MPPISSKSPVILMIHSKLWVAGWIRSWKNIHPKLIFTVEAALVNPMTGKKTYYNMANSEDLTIVFCVSESWDYLTIMVCNLLEFNFIKSSQRFSE